jgi:twitching motility two-component system response regulator PilH
MSPSRRPRISVVNDNPEFLEVMSAILADESGYEVTLHAGETTSIAELRDAQPDLVIVDLLLGAASGWEIAALVRADDRIGSIPMIICSADIGQLDEKRDELERIGNIHLLRKPFGIEDVTRLVERLVGGSEPAPATAGG